MTSISAANAAKEAQLRRMQRFALALLLLAAAGFAVTVSLPPSFWVSGAKTVCEAAMVGALADWFAVTALFRRPLSLPIPHTAVIPRSKDRIGENLAVFVRDEFLAPATLVALLQRQEPARRLAEWLREPANGALLAHQVRRLLLAVLAAVSNAQAEGLMQRAARELIGRIDLNRSMATVLETLTHNGRHQELLDAGMEKLAAFLQQEDTRAMVAQGVVEWLKTEHAWKEKVLPTEWLGKKAAEVVTERLNGWIKKAADDQGHQLRGMFNNAVAQLIQRLRNDPEWASKAEEIRDYLRNDPALGRYLQELWLSLRTSLQSNLNDPESSIGKKVQVLAVWLGRSLADDEDLRKSIDDQLTRWVSGLAPDVSQFVGRHIQETVQRWDAEALSRLIEINIGRDLQYIRINGTLVGGLIGAVLFLLSSLPAWLRGAL